MRRNILPALVLLVLAAFAHANKDNVNWFNWSQMPSLSAFYGQTEPLGAAGVFAGVHNDALIIAGGANFAKPYEQTVKQWHDDVFVLEKNSKQWLTGFKLDIPIAYGASVSTKYGVVCIGGNDENQSYADVFLLKWDGKEKKIIKSNLPSLPLACSHTSAAVIGDTVYIAGGQQGTNLSTAMKNFWSLDLSKIPEPNNLNWKQLPEFPGQRRAFNITAAQHNGKEYCVYVIGGRYQENADDANWIAHNDIYEFSPSKSVWKKCSDLPYPVHAVCGIDAGQSHILIFGTALKSQTDNTYSLGCFNRDVLAYHTITDTVIKAGQMPISQVTTTAVKWHGGIIIPSGEICPRIRTPQIWKAELQPLNSNFGVVNFTTLGIYLLGIIAVGVYFAGRNKTTDDFFRGGKRIPAWAAGLSIFSTLLSSITFLAIPAKVYSADWTFITVNLIMLPIVPLILVFVVPYFRRIDATSAYEYLEKRFNIFIRLFASLSFVFFQVGRMAIVMFLPALALSTMTSLTVPQCILIMGVMSVIYCTIGGLEAVVWTEAVQSFVLLGGALLCFVIIIMSLENGFSEFFRIASANNKFHAVNWDFSSTSFYTTALWVMIIGGIGQTLVPYVSDQAIVQRYVSVATVKQVRDSFITNISASLIATILFFAIGTALYVFYKTNPQTLDPTYQNDAIFPLFISNNLPTGIAGIVVAGVFAAAQSTISTSMNSISTVVVTDFVKRFSLLKTEKAYLNLARFCTLFFGILGTALALLFASADIKSLWESFMEVLGLFGGPMCGLFLLGMFTKRVGGTAAIIGAVSGAVILFLVSRYTKVNLVLYASVGIAACVLVGYLMSFVIPEKGKDLSGLTLHNK
ncbi:MAG: sodium/solute symporter [Phycisphaerales bacterium]